MKKKPARIKIAEVMGWKIPVIGAGPNTGEFSPDFIFGPNGETVLLSHLDRADCLLPDYLNDLDAMHEAEKVLSPAQDWEYYKLLRLVTGDNEHRATAAQRAEAFLRTLGLWED